MELSVLLGLLKWLFIVWEVSNHITGKKREKALIGTVESFDQRLNLLESKLKRKP